MSTAIMQIIGFYLRWLNLVHFSSSPGTDSFDRQLGQNWGLMVGFDRVLIRVACLFTCLLVCLLACLDVHAIGELGVENYTQALKAQFVPGE